MASCCFCFLSVSRVHPSSINFTSCRTPSSRLHALSHPSGPHVLQQLSSYSFMLYSLPRISSPCSAAHHAIHWQSIASSSILSMYSHVAPIHALLITLFISNLQSTSLQESICNITACKRLACVINDDTTFQHHLPFDLFCCSQSMPSGARSMITSTYACPHTHAGLNCHRSLTIYLIS